MKKLLQEFFLMNEWKDDERLPNDERSGEFYGQAADSIHGGALGDDFRDAAQQAHDLGQNPDDFADRFTGGANLQNPTTRGFDYGDEADATFGMDGEAGEPGEVQSYTGDSRVADNDAVKITKVPDLRGDDEGMADLAGGADASVGDDEIPIGSLEDPAGDMDDFAVDYGPEDDEGEDPYVVKGHNPPPQRGDMGEGMEEGIKGFFAVNEADDFDMDSFMKSFEGDLAPDDDGEPFTTDAAEFKKLFPEEAADLEGQGVDVLQGEFMRTDGKRIMWVPFDENDPFPWEYHGKKVGWIQHDETTLVDQDALTQDRMAAIEKQPKVSNTTIDFTRRYPNMLTGEPPKEPQLTGDFDTVYDQEWMKQHQPAYSEPTALAASDDTTQAARKKSATDWDQEDPEYAEFLKNFGDRLGIKR
jgi:hypothetical protein